MADYYIDPSTGDDTTGSGTSSYPWATLQKGVDNANGGDTIYLANTAADVFSSSLTWNTGFGTFNGTSSGTTLRIVGWDNGGSLTMTMPGSQTAVTVGEVNGNSTVTAYDSSSGRPAFVTYHGIRFKDFVPASSNAMVQGISAYTIFLNCEFADITASEFGLAMNNQGMVVGCYFHGVNNARGISGAQGHVADCYFNVKGYAALFTGSSPCSFVNNVVYSEASNFEPALTSSAPITLVKNNTFHCKEASTADCVTAGAEEMVCINNIFSGYSGTGGSGIGSSVNVTGYNCFHNCTTSETTPDYSLGNNVTTDPSFADAANEDFTPSGAGVLSSGFPRLPGSSTDNSFDIGAVQEQASSGGGGSSYTPAASAKFTRLE